MEKQKNRTISAVERFCDRYRYVFAVLYVAFCVSVPFLGLSRVQMRLGVMIGLYAVLGMGLNVLLGYTGLVSLGHAGFYGIGAYVCALLQVNAGWSFWPALLAAGLFSALIGFLLGLPSLRLTGTYLSIVTLGFCEIVQMILKQWESVTNGNYGVRNIPKPTLFGLELNLANGGFLIFVLVLAAVTALACTALRNSNMGRAWRAIKDDELAATMMGIRVSRCKIIAFVVSAFITGMVKTASGTVLLDGANITNLSPHKIVQRGISLSPEGREVFPALTVEENLRLGAFTRPDKEERRANFDRVYSLFPRLKERNQQTAGTLSGGEQQMLAIGRALMSSPRILLLDEPSMGLAPNLVLLIFDLIRSINQQGTTILLIEQNANMALSVANRAYVLESGQISLEGNARDLIRDDRVRKAYLGR